MSLWTDCGSPSKCPPTPDGLERAWDQLVGLDRQAVGGALIAKLTEVVGGAAMDALASKPRGRQARRHGVASVHWAAAWTYALVEQEVARAEAERYPVVHRAIKEVVELGSGGHDGTALLDITARLVRDMFGERWKAWDLKDPREPDYDLDSFRRCYISKDNLVKIRSLSAARGWF